MSKGIHRVTPTSEQGRRMTGGGGIEHEPWKIAKDIREHNRRIDAQKAAKKQAKKARKA